jgi:hypothetical protein
VTAPGQLDLDGGEQVDPRVERAAKALWLRDARKTFGRQDALELAKAHWPRVRGEYMATALVAITAADKA